MALRALLAVLVLASSAFAQNPQTDASRAATAALKAFTDQLKLASPPALYEGRAGYETAQAFKTSFFNDYTRYHALFLWSEDGGPDEGLSAERFQLAYAKASDNGRDQLKGMRWTCELAERARGYFGYYNEAHGRGDAGLALLGTQYNRVQFATQVIDAIADRHKEASGIDIKRALRYNSRAECETNGEQIVATETKGKEPETRAPPASVVELHPNPAPWEKPDFSRYDYFVFYFDASWQPWTFVASRKGWSRDDLEKFVLRRAPEWVGSFVSRAPKSDRGAVARSWRSGPPGEVLRHPLQPKSAAERDRKLIAEHRAKYKLK